MSRGRLVHARVVSDLGVVLERALDDSITGVGTVEPQDALLLDADGRGELAFDDGVPVAARHTETGRTGREALAELSVPGPCRVELYEARSLPAFADDAGASVPPALPAELLASDPELANRVRSVASERGAGGGPDADALDAFLEDEERIAAIQREARREAAARAKEWGLEDALADDAGERPVAEAPGDASGPAGPRDGSDDGRGRR